MSEVTHQTTLQKITTFFAGLGGMSLSLVDVAQTAQQIGMIVGCILVCGQAWVFFKGLCINRERRKPSNGQ